MEQNTTPNDGLQAIFGNEMGFAAAEAYKTLRANLMYTLPNKEGCRIIGVTSPQRGEGKSTTVLNLAYSLMESGKRVLLVEGDMRMPTLAGKMRMPSTPGLSNLLVSKEFSRSVVLSRYQDTTLFFLMAGDIPPNPSELLDSQAMKELLAYYATGFDFILIDLPPILAVSDALVVSRLVDGMLIIVRHDFTDRAQLSDAIRQLRVGNTRILGFVYNAMSESAGKYARKYKNYYHRYYRTEGSASSSTTAKNAAPAAPRRAK